MGHFDPYSDDPRLAVKKVQFCGRTGRLLVGGTAGQVVVLELAEAGGEIADSSADGKAALTTLVKADLVTEKEGFAWKGHSPLSLKNPPTDQKPTTVNTHGREARFQPTSILQISPPASINSIGFCSAWGLLAAGTAHGLIIYDIVQKVVVTSKCTLNAQGKEKKGPFVVRQPQFLMNHP